MRVATVDGLVTLFYDGSKELYNDELNREWVRACRFNGNADIEAMDLSDECKSYFRERLSWQQIIVVDCITEIPLNTFRACKNIKIVIFADTVIRIQRCAFLGCKNLIIIKLSLSLEYIGDYAFFNCNLSNVFIPPGCREIGFEAFGYNENLTILNVPRNTELGNLIISFTKLYRSCPNPSSQEEIKTWLKNINNHESFALHRVCSSFEPTLEMIVDTMKEKGGPQAFQVENDIGITPSKYLKENPYANVKENEIIKDYILQMTGAKF